MGLIIFLSCITIPLLFYHQTLDDFFPKHIAQLIAIISNGNLVQTDVLVTQIPGFYTLGSVISLVCGLPPESLMYLPIQLIPYSILLFFLLFRIGGNVILAGCVTLIDLSSGVTGTGKIFFWPHGIGSILFFLILILVLGFLQNNQRREFLILTIVTGASLVFLSYNLTAMTLFLLVIVGVLSGSLYYFLLRFELKNQVYLNIARQVLISAVIIACVEFGLSKFAYGSFLPTLRATENLDLTSLDKFSVSFVDPNLTDAILSPIMVHYPISITIISLLKYGILAITILLYGFVVTKKFFHELKIDYIDILLLSLISMEIFYAVPRLLIGGAIATLVWIPGILCLIRLTGVSKKYRIMSVVVIGGLLILTLSSYAIFTLGGDIDRISYDNDGYKESNQWFNQYAGSALFCSDELTRNFMILYDIQTALTEKKGDLDFTMVAEQSPLLRAAEAAVLTNLQAGELNKRWYYVLNNRLSKINLDNWITLQSWRRSESLVDANDKINKIYDNSLLAVYPPI